MSQRPHYPVPDDAAFSRHEFYADPWASWMSNGHHFVETRGRVVAGERFTDVTLGAAFAEVGRFVFDATPDVTRYRARCIFGANTKQHSAMSIHWRIDSENTAGGSTKTGLREDVVRVDPGRIPEDRGLVRDDSGPLPYFYPKTTRGVAFPEFESGWIDHEPNSALGTSGVVLKIMAYKTHPLHAVFADVPLAYFRGCMIFGLKDDV